MKKITAIVFASVMVMLALTPSPLLAQWSEIAPNVTPAPSQHIGALRFRDGVAWAGTESLFFSDDTGVTWNPVPSFQSFSGITDIAIFDSLNVMVGTTGEGLFLTTDGGQTWQELLGQAPDLSQVAFNGSPSVLHALTYNSSTLFTSTDAGATWSGIQTTNSGSTGALCFAVAPDKTIYVQSYDGGQGWTNKSTDLGQTWSSDGNGTDGDSDALAVDSCNHQKLYLINENTVQRSGNETRIDMTSDAGATWQTLSAVPLDFYNGSIASTANVLYVGTVPKSRSGVQRSTDDGVTWINIGGPIQEFDTRTIATVNSNIVLVLDSGGNVWRTMNSGGDSLTVAETSIARTLVISAQPVAMDQMTCSTPADTSIPLGIVGCGTPTGSLDSLWITGSTAFQIADSRTSPRTLATIDSILVSYLGSIAGGAQGSDTAELHIRYDIGPGAHDTTIQLVGTIASPLISQPSQLHRESASSYFGQIDSLPLGVDINSTINMDSLWPFISDIQMTYSWDSSVATYGGYFPPSGWSLTSLASQGNAENIEIQNNGSTATQPMDLGTALFYPRSTQLATTWVALPRFVIDIGNRSLALCVTDNEDNHWAVKTLGSLSVVAEVSAFVQNLSLYPNPADGNVWIDASNDLGDATIEVYDMLGREQSIIHANVEKDAPVELVLPEANGVYNILVRSAGGMSSLRVVRQH